MRKLRPDRPHQNEQKVQLLFYYFWPINMHVRGLWQDGLGALRIVALLHSSNCLILALFLTGLLHFPFPFTDILSYHESLANAYY